MSEVFDPEKVSRWTCTSKDDCKKDDKGDCVAAEDYDKLLALYREATKCPNCGHHKHFALRCGTPLGEGLDGQSVNCECLNW